MVFVILYLLYILGQKNPFDRVVFRKMFVVSSNSIDHFDCQICFTKHADYKCLHDAIFAAIYQAQSSSWDYRSPSLRFQNFVGWNTITNAFQPFHFSTISFLDVDPSHFKCVDYLYLPCEELELPQKIEAIDFRVDEIPHIKALLLRSTGFVPLSPYSPTMYADPIRASQPLDIQVPPELLSKYRNDPAWGSLKFIDDDGNIKSVTFNGHTPIDHRTVSRCIHC